MRLGVGRLVLAIASVSFEWVAIRAPRTSWRSLISPRDVQPLPRARAASGGSRPPFLSPRSASEPAIMSGAACPKS